MAYIPQKKESDDDIISNTSSNSLYMEQVPFNIRGRSEWWELKHSEILLYEKVAEGKKYFKEVKVFKPKSSRKDSKESFIICQKLR